MITGRNRYGRGGGKDDRGGCGGGFGSRGGSYGGGGGRSRYGESSGVSSCGGANYNSGFGGQKGFWKQVVEQKDLVIPVAHLNPVVIITNLVDMVPPKHKMEVDIQFAPSSA